MKAWQLHLILRELRKQREHPAPDRTQAEIDADPFVRMHRKTQADKAARRARRLERRERRRAK